jgi:uncharacterized protein (DUF488 family)
MPEKLLTIGVYGFTERGFFQALVDANVDLFCDIRARRGLRGSEYAFANAQRLQAQLAERGIRYIHIKNLAPSPEVRESQSQEDLRTGTTKRDRDKLGEVFTAKYRETCLAGLDASALLQEHIGNARWPVFFCVERAPAACHRSLLTDELSRQTGLPVEHILP